jgi:lipopolysaccharide transport system permease protein
MTSAFGIYGSLATNWSFAKAMAAREMKGLYQGAVLGLAWLIIRPLVQVVAYVVIVSYVFGVRIGPAAGPVDYAIHVLSGLFAWQAVQRSLEEAPSLVRDRIEILKQVIYPIETLPITAMLSSGLGPAIVLAAYLVLAAATGQLSWTIVLLPIPLALLAGFILGASWILMVIGAVLKDLREMVSVVLGLLVYVSPVLLSEEMVGERLWSIILLNPLAHIVISFRDVLTGGFHPTSWAVFAASAAFALLLGGWLVQRTKLAINELI